MTHKLNHLDECTVCGLTAEDIVRLPFTMPTCTGKPDPVGKFMATEIRSTARTFPG